ncbi:MAG: flavin reductase family protein [Clostridiales bacterium]|nr:flavin reductase family protein [Clostridiales bacterium]
MWKEIKPEECKDNAFSMIGKEWMLIAAGDEKKANAMTASWGGIGVMWGKNVAYIVVRPQRYTKEFLDKEERFSLNFLPEKYRKELNYMGTVSGRNEDKMAKSGLNVTALEAVPAIGESRMVMVCRKMFAQEMQEESFIQKETVEKWYPQNDFHTLYIAEIEKIFVQE